MDKELWDMFFETGEPICYILCKSAQRSENGAADGDDSSSGE